MRVLSHTVSAAEDGRTVKELLRGLWHISGSLLSRLKFRDALTVNGVPVPVNRLLRAGDILRADVSDLPGENPHILPVDYPLTVLYEDEDLLLLDKPAGIAIHPAALTEETATIAGAVAHYLQSDSFHAVNRLDRGTTGVMAVAKTGFVHARCMTLLHTDGFQRDYRAVCDGLPPHPEGDIDLPLGRAEGSLLKRCPAPGGAVGPHPLSGSLRRQRTGAAASDAHHRPHPPAAGTHGRHRLPPHRRLALRHGGQVSHRPSRPPQLSPADDAPRHRRGHRRHRPSAGGYTAAVEGGTSMNFRLLTAKEYPRWYHDPSYPRLLSRRNASLCPIFSVCWRKDVTRYGDCLTKMSC